MIKTNFLGLQWIMLLGFFLSSALAETETKIVSDLGYDYLAENDAELESLRKLGKLKEIYPSKRSLKYRLPYKFDISTDKAFPPIGKQVGPCCASYSTVYYNASYLIAKRDGLDMSKDSSIGMSPYYIYAMAEQSGKGIGGTTLRTPMHAMMSHGNLTFTEWPVTVKNYSKRWNLDPVLWRKALTRRMKSASVIYNADTPEGVAEIKRKLIDTTFAVTVGGPDSKRGFEMRPLKQNSKAPENAKYAGETGCIWSHMGLGGHAMALVGYNDSIWLDVNDNNQIDHGEMGAWKIANSYGVDFPEIKSNKGFHWISYDATRDSSIVAGLDTKGENRVNVFLYNKVEAVEIMPANYKPKVVAEVTLHCAGRMDPRFTFFKTTVQDDPPFNTANSWKEFLFGTKSGSQSNRIGFDAVNYDDDHSAAPEGTFMFDITEYVPNDFNNPWRFGLSVLDKYEDKATHIKSVKVIYYDDGGDVVFFCKKSIPPFDNDTKNFWVDVPSDPEQIQKNILQPKQGLNFSAKCKKGEMTLSLLPVSESPVVISINDLTGKEVFQTVVEVKAFATQSVKIPTVGTWGANVYFVSATQNNITLTKRVIIQN